MKYLITFLGIFTFFLFILTLHVPAAEPIALTLAFEDKDSYPNYLGNGETINQEKPGFAVEFLKLVEKKLHIKIEFVRLPWKRCLAAMQLNTIDGVFNASYKKYRLKYGRYPMTSDGQVDESRKITDMAYSFFKLRSSDIEWNGKKLKNLSGKICTVLGYSVGDDLRKEGYQIDETTSPRALLDMLVYERCKIIASSSTQIKELIANSGNDAYSRIVELKPPYKVKPYYLMLSHQFVQQHHETAEKIWNTIGELRDSDQVKTIRLKYDDYITDRRQY